jgi:Ca-activated chloride channel homolog
MAVTKSGLDVISMYRRNDMANVNAVPGTNSARPAGLVAVDGRTYPLKSAQVEARAEGGIAATTFTQSYENPYQEALEVLYTMPLPANGAVTGYTIRLGERVIRGEVRRRAEAQEEYRQALVEGRTAALLEQDRADTFTQKLGCLPPGQTAQIEIEVLQPLVFLPSAGERTARWEYRFPTVVGVRYEGAPGRVPDAARLDVDRAAGEGTPVRLAARLFIADGSGSSIHPQMPGKEIDLEDCDGGVRLSLREGMRLDRDLVVRWDAAQAEVGVRLVEGKGLPSDDGRYLLITLTPPAAVRKSIARDLTILIDASGSMSGKPLDRAKGVVEQLLRSLESGDRFEILAFADRVERLVPHPVDASNRNLQKALEALAKLEASGSTEMAQAITAALEPLRRDSQRQVILLSDGYIGFEGEVIGEVMRKLVPGARLHVVGIGAAPNRTLTRGAARAGRGVEILVGDDDDALAASQRLLQATVRPVLTDVVVKGAALVAQAPARAQDVLEGQPLVLLAEISAQGGDLEITGRHAGASGKWLRRLDIPPAQGGGETSGAPARTSLPLGALFGREAIEDLELQVTAAGRGREAEALEGKIEALGLRHGIASRKTSLIAVSEDPTVDPRDPRRRERLAVEMPAEVSAEGAGLMAQSMMAFPAAPAASFVQLARMMPSTEFRECDLSMDLGDRAEESMGYSYEPVEHKKEAIESHYAAPGREPERVEIFGVRILFVEGPRLTFEFEVPMAGFFLPEDGSVVYAYFDDGTVREAIVIGMESSPEGPHHPGLTVRLALLLSDEYGWQHVEAQIAWTAVGDLQVNLHIPLGM